MKRPLFVIASILVMSITRAAVCEDEEDEINVVRACMHMHTSFSDGKYFPKDFGEMLEGKCEAVFFTDHSDCFSSAALTHNKTAWYNKHYHSGINCYKCYRDDVDAMNSSKLIAIPGLEVTVGDGTLCHIGYITSGKPSYAFGTGYTPNDLSYVLQTMGKGAVSIYNHPHHCEEWKNRLQEFSCIELFNDVEVDIGELPIVVTRNNYTDNLQLALDAWKNGWDGCVVGGSDFHRKLTEMINNPRTYLFPEEKTRKSVIEALQDGRSIAVNNMEVEYVGMYPSKTVLVNPNTTFTLGMALRVPKGQELAPHERKFNVYINGKFAYDDTLGMGDEEKGDGYTYYYIKTFFGPGPRKKSYVIEIPGRMVTSPYLLQLPTIRLPFETDRILGLPGEVFDVTNFVTEYSPEEVTFSKDVQPEVARSTRIKLCTFHSRMRYGDDGYVYDCGRPVFDIQKEPGDLSGYVLKYDSLGPFMGTDWLEKDLEQLILAIVY